MEKNVNRFYDDLSKAFSNSRKIEMHIHNDTLSSSLTFILDELNMDNGINMTSGNLIVNIANGFSADYDDEEDMYVIKDSNNSEVYFYFL